MGFSSQDPTDLTERSMLFSTAEATAPALTILWHPDPSRVGSMFSFSDLGQSRLLLSRDEPTFLYYTQDPQPLAHSSVSRQPLLEFLTAGPNFILAPSPGAPITLDGQPLDRALPLTSADLARSPILTIRNRIALCLHFARRPPTPLPPDLGLLGNSDVMHHLRQTILAVAPRSTPVLIRGETGTGKELTAKAILANSLRRDKPYLAVNIGALPEELAAGELFGHEKGAFTGASETRDGFFQEVHGGTLFLDEIGLASPDVQTALLRVLETGEVRKLGGRASRRVDVRLLAATDSVAIDHPGDGPPFSSALFYRLDASSIHLPPLRKRREDLGVLLLHFLKEALAETGDVGKLQTPPQAKPWLSANVFPMLGAAEWPGNIRQLRNFALKLATQSLGDSHAQLSEALLDSLRTEDVNPPLSTPAKSDRLSPDKIREALERNDFQPAKAARDLGVSRDSIYRHMPPNLTLLSDEEFRSHVTACNGDLRLVAEKLKVSYRAVQLRFNKL